MNMRILILLIAGAAPLAFGGGKMLKPFPGPGTGEETGGLRASISCVKSSFGPGESIVIIWKLSNESEQSKTVELYKGLTGTFSAEIRQNGRSFKSTSISFDQAGVRHTIEPGQSITRMIDLLELSFEDKSWRDKQGSFDVAVTLSTSHIVSGWANFKITAPGEGKPPIAPELAEKIRSLISQLGDNEFATREKAYAQLREIGKPAIALLDEVATAGADLEVVSRCKKLIEEIRRGTVNPPPPPPMVEPLPFRPIPQPRSNRRIEPPPPPQVAPPQVVPPQVGPKPIKPVLPPPPPAVKPPRPPEEFEF